MSAGKQQSKQDDPGSDPAAGDEPDQPEAEPARPVGERQAAENRKNESPA